MLEENREKGDRRELDEGKDNAEREGKGRWVRGRA